MQKIGSQYHLKIKPGDVGRYVLLPGDPGRCEEIAMHFDDPHRVVQNREFNIWTGTLLGEKISVCSTGIGGPSAAIAIEELHNVGADTFIRVGTCGGIELSILPDDLVIPTGAVRYEHTSVEYAPIEFPAVPDLDLTVALRQSAQELGYTYHIGVVQCKDSFYGQHIPERMPVAYELTEKWEAWKRLGVKASEMESAALFVIAAALDCRCASCLHVVWNQEREAAGFMMPMAESTASAINTSVEAMKKIIAQDKK